MIIKSADDKSKRLALLEELQKSAQLDARQRDWLSKELFATRTGASGERDAAHYLNSHFSDGKNHMVLHDLRVVVDGEVAQIDHLIVARGFIFYLLETKTFGGDILINELGEFAVRYAGGRVFGIPSPVEQSKRHEKVLGKLLQQLEITGRLRSKPQFEHVVLVHPKATIQRPSARAFDTGNIIKADQFATWHQKFADRMSVGGLLATAADLRSSDTIKEWAERIARQHQPADSLVLPQFMRQQSARLLNDDVRQSNVSAAPALASVRQAAAQAIATSQTSPGATKKLICMDCGAKISYSEGKFCWNNAQRFGGGQYCREHQAAFAS